MRVLLVVVLVALCIAGCMTAKQKADRVSLLVDQKIAEMKLADPEIAITPAITEKLTADAKKQVADEIKKAQEDAAAKVAAAGGAAATGNWIGAALLLLGAAGIGLGVFKTA